MLLVNLKYADESIAVIPVCRGMRDETEKALDSFLHWTAINNMICNTDNCKEVLSLREESKQSSLTVSTEDRTI